MPSRTQLFVWTRSAGRATPLWLLVASLLAAQQPASSDTAPPEEVRRLIGQLGDPEFTVRERAAEQLAQQGMAAKAALTAALGSTDPETRYRARHLLAVLDAAEFERRLKAFADDVDDAHHFDLPAWATFRQSVAARPAARALFVKMQRAEAALLDAYERDAKQAGEALSQRAGIIYQQVRPRSRRDREQGPANLGSMSALLWVAGDTRVPLSNETAARLVDLPQHPTFQQAMSAQADLQREPLRKLLGRWVMRELNPVLVPRNLATAANYDLPEALTLAVSALNRGNMPSDARCMGLLILGKHGSQEHLPLAEALLGDTDPCANFGGFNRRRQTQLRDVALAVSIQLAGQNPGQFGFEELQTDARGMLEVSTVGFAGDKDRSAAQAKWEEWKKSRKQASVAGRNQTPLVE